MRLFLAGCLFGVLITGVVSAYGPQIVGASGYLNGVTVKYRGGERICQDPWVWIEGQTATIECNKPR
jgi:hypothetical protein